MDSIFLCCSEQQKCVHKISEPILKIVTDAISIYYNTTCASAAMPHEWQRFFDPTDNFYFHHASLRTVSVYGIWINLFVSFRVDYFICAGWPIAQNKITDLLPFVFEMWQIALCFEERKKEITDGTDRSWLLKRKRNSTEVMIWCFNGETVLLRHKWN